MSLLNEYYDVALTENGYIRMFSGNCWVYICIKLLREALKLKNNKVSKFEKGWDML